MLPHSERLTTTEFARAFGQSRVLRGSILHLRVHFRDNRRDACQNGTDEMPPPRTAFVVPKKLGKATVRNRTRRRVREYYRLHPLRRESTLSHCDLIFLATPETIAANRAQLDAAITQLLHKAMHMVPTAKGERPARSFDRSFKANKKPESTPSVS